MLIPLKASQYKTSAELSGSISTHLRLYSWILTVITIRSFSWANTPLTYRLEKLTTVHSPPSPSIDTSWDTCIIVWAYIFLAELVSPPKKNPPKMVFRVWHVTVLRATLRQFYPSRCVPFPTQNLSEKDLFSLLAMTCHP